VLLYPQLLHLTFVEGGATYGRPFDFRTGFLAAIIVCDPVPPVVSGEPQEACMKHGIPGVVVTMPDHPGRAVYHGTGFATDRTLSSVTTFGGVLWENVAPGTHEVLVYPPPGAKGLDCAVWGGSNGRGETLPGTSPVHVSMRVRPSINSVTFLDCKTIK
jgi:hypothetical protein